MLAGEDIFITVSGRYPWKASIGLAADWPMVANTQRRMASILQQLNFTPFEQDAIAPCRYTSLPAGIPIISAGIVLVSRPEVDWRFRVADKDFARVALGG